MKIVKLRKRERESSIDSSTLVLTSLGHIRGNPVLALFWDTYTNHPPQESTESGHIVHDC